MNLNRLTLSNLYGIRDRQKEAEKADILFIDRSVSWKSKRKLTPGLAWIKERVSVTADSSYLEQQAPACLVCGVSNERVSLATKLCLLSRATGRHLQSLESRLLFLPLINAHAIQISILHCCYPLPSGHSPSLSKIPSTLNPE